MPLTVIHPSAMLALLEVWISRFLVNGAWGSQRSPMPHALCPMPYAPCPMPHALCPMPYALCPMPYALCPMPYALCPMLIPYY